MKAERWAKTIIASLERDLGLLITEMRESGRLIFKGVLNGVHFQWTVSKQPGDFRADKKALSALRRELRKCGIEEPPRMTPRAADSATLSNEAWDSLRAWEEHLAASESTT